MAAVAADLSVMIRQTMRSRYGWSLHQYFGLRSAMMYWPQFVLHEFVGAGPDRGGVGRVLKDIRAFGYVPWNDITEVGESAQQEFGRNWAAVAEDRGMFVRCIDGLKVLLQRGAEVEMLLPQFERVVLNFGGGKGLSVVPGDPFAQFEGDRFAILGSNPRRGQHRNNLALGIEINR